MATQGAETVASLELDHGEYGRGVKQPRGLTVTSSCPSHWAVCPGTRLSDLSPSISKR